MKGKKDTTSVIWLSKYQIVGIDFRLGDNGVQLFYEAKVRGITWIVMRLKSTHYWVVIAYRNGWMKTLNFCILHWDGTVEKDPLYHSGEYRSDVPTVLLESVANYIKSGANPFVRHWHISPVLLLHNSFSFRRDRECQQFRSWLSNVGADELELPSGAFGMRDRPTNVKTKFLVINKLMDDATCIYAEKAAFTNVKAFATWKQEFSCLSR